MLRIIVSVIIVALFSHLTRAQIPGFGSCPDLAVVNEFSVDRFLGTWFEVQKYPFAFTLGGKCISTDYDLTIDGKISMFIKQIIEGRESTIDGIGKQTQLGAGDLRVSFPSVRFQTEYNFKILDTDYDNYAVVFSCNSFLNLINGKVVWILTRTRFPSRNIIGRAHEIMRINGLSTSYLATTDNTDCPDDLHNGIDNFRDQLIDLD